MKLLLLVALGLVTTIADDTQLLEAFNNRYIKFTSNLYKELLKSNSENFLICPMSVDVILAIVRAGAKGNTANQISDALKFPKSSVIQQTFKALAPIFHNDIGLKFANLNKIYVRDGFQITSNYRRKVVETFHAEIENIDFKQSEEAADAINSWIQVNTNNEVHDIVSESDFDDESSMVLISTMFFYTSFVGIFEEKDIHKQDFYLNEEDTFEIDMMEQIYPFPYYESKELNAKFLSLQFVGTSESVMTFVLPNDIEGLADLETKLEKVLVQHPFSEQNVHVFIPKFKIETTIKFKSILQNLGIIDAFMDGANFTKIGTKQEALKIDNIFQKVHIEVDQFGANTAFGRRLGLSSAFVKTEQMPYFRADHPFLFYISLYGQPVYVGRFTSISDISDITPKKDVFTPTTHQPEIKPKINLQEEPIISIVDEHMCPCNSD